MANLTINEFSDAPEGDQGVTWPADNATRVTSTAGIRLRPETQYVIITADADCRVAFGNPDAATASDTPILSAVSNPFRVRGGITLKFT